MTKYIINGGKPLHGTVTISGAKNAAVAILPATLLVKGVCKIENVPNISDVRLLLEILTTMGALVRRLSPNTLEIDCTHVTDSVAPIDLVRRRGEILHGQCHHQRLRYCRGRWPVYDDCRAGQGRGAVRRAGRICL